jgi:DNA-binding NarL/FixJ family response regulator
MLDQNRPVLVADDDAYFRLALTALLRGPLGFSRVVEAGSVDEALEQLSAEPGSVAMALFDLSMPGMNGPGTLAAVRECFPDVLVAVVSASEDRQNILTALENGVHGYIPKRFGPMELVRAIKVVIAGDVFVPRSLADSFRVTKSVALAASNDSGTALPDGAGSPSLIAGVSPRQREVLALLVRGYSNKQIANALSLGEGTIKIHVTALLRNLGVANRASAAAAGALLLRS